METLSQPTTSKPSFRFPIFIGFLIGFLVTATIAAAAFVYLRDQPPASPTIVTPTLSPVSPTAIPTFVSDSTNYGQFGQITWLPQPQKLSSFSVFRPETINVTNSDMPHNGGVFYQVATFSDGSKLIDGFITFQIAANDVEVVRFVQTPTKTYYLTNLLQDWVSSILSTDLLASTAPLTLSIDGLSGPESITKNNQVFTKVYDLSTMFSDLANPQLLFDSGYGSFYQVSQSIVPSAPDIMGKIYYLKLKDALVAQYQLSDGSIHKYDWTPSITWSDNTSNTTVYSQNIVMSCGSGGVGTPYLKDGSSALANKKQIGINKLDNQPVYQILDDQSPVVKAIYDLYKTGRDYPSAPPILSLSDFAQRRNHFIWQDATGDWQIFLNSDFAPAAECGKPVIYLYPTRTTDISVKVGASISQSEPSYPASGWTVTASPSGQLTYQNQSYSYLFWEGQGNGPYPDYRRQGTVVAQKDLIATLHSHLTQLGLNDKESADFMEFWQPKLPTAPYVRLTWLGTGDMNRLAPLSVSPRPDTTIRLFLEFEGLSQPLSLTPQKLSAPVRRGFTLVEWGGLLLNSSL